MNSPLVSVIIPTFNSEKYIHECLTSVLKQTYKNLEIIVIDNESIDTTHKIVEDFISRDSRIKIVTIEGTGLPSVPRNKGIELAKGDYVAFLDSDDLWNKYKLEEQVSAIGLNVEMTFVYSMSITIGEVNILSEFYELLPLPFRKAKNRNDLLTIGNTIPLSSVLVRTSALRDVGGFDEDPELKVEDYDLWLRFSEKGNFHFLPRLHVYYRIHAEQFSADWETRKKRIDYLAAKRNLKLPEHRKLRHRGFLFLILRNLIHYLIYKVIILIDTLVRLFSNRGK